MSIQVSKGGIMIPEKAQQKVNEAVVIAVGPGARIKVCVYHKCMYFILVALKCCDL